MNSVSHWLPAIVYAGVIFFFSHQSDPPGPDLPEFAPDYVLHFLEYGFFSLSLVWGLTSKLRKDLSVRDSAWAWLTATIYGVSDEIHQSFIPQREASFNDLLADALGALSFVIFLYFVRKR